jgi:hypothetical protein
VVEFCFENAIKSVPKITVYSSPQEQAEEKDEERQMSRNDYMLLKLHINALVETLISLLTPTLDELFGVGLWVLSAKKILLSSGVGNGHSTLI